MHVRIMTPRILCLAALFIVTACGNAPTSAQNTSIWRPNILLILVDDLGWSDTGIYGSSFYETPNIDELARNSTMFSAAYAASPVCSPTRASLLTGRHPTRLGITDYIPGASFENTLLQTTKPINNHLPLAQVTVAEVLQSVGYRTFFAGKWHLGGNGYLPQDQGFDINRGGDHFGSPPGGYYSPYNNAQLRDGPEGEHLTDRLTKDTIDFIREKSEAPFFAMLSYYAVHTPLEAAPHRYAHFRQKARQLADSGTKDYVLDQRTTTRTMQNNAEYASMIFAIDAAVGQLIKALEQSELADNTVVIFTSDNGGLSTLLKGRRSPSTTNEPLRRGKGWLYEGGIRVPLLVKAPQRLPSGPSSVPTTTADLFPTILDIAHITSHDRSGLDGESLFKLVYESHIADSRPLIWHFPHYHGSGWTPGAALRLGRWKLIHFYEDQRLHLYDLEADLSESRDVAGNYPEVTARLFALLCDWYHDAGAVIPKRSPASLPTTSSQTMQTASAACHER